MEIIRERDADRSKVSIIGIVDSLTAPELERELSGLLDEGVKSLLLDLEKTEYLSSAGIRTFLRIAKRLDAAGGALRFRGVHGVVRDVFRVTGVDRLFNLDGEPLQ
jgi:anti-sigma B factor antagonist